jgi:DNA-binding NtrC family response regulator
VCELFQAASCEFVLDEDTKTLENYLRCHTYFEAIVINLRKAALVEEYFDFIGLMKEICPRAEVIFMARFADEKMWVESIQHGAYDLIPTPIDRKEFYRIVRNALEKNRPSQ